MEIVNSRESIDRLKEWSISRIRDMLHSFSFVQNVGKRFE